MPPPTRMNNASSVPPKPKQELLHSVLAVGEMIMVPPSSPARREQAVMVPSETVAGISARRNHRGAAASRRWPWSPYACRKTRQAPVRSHDEERDGAPVHNLGVVPARSNWV